MKSIRQRLAVLVAVIAVVGTLSAFASAPPAPVFNPQASQVIAAPEASPARLDYMFESFESNWPPTGWQILHLGAGYQWAVTTSAARTGLRSAMCRNGSAIQTQDEWLVTKPLNLSTLTQPKLEFYEEEVNWVARGHHHYIMVSTSNPTNPAGYTVVMDMTPANHAIAGFGGGPVTVDLSPWAGASTVYVAFRYTGTNADIWLIDDVRLYELLERDIMAVSVSPADQHYAAGAQFTPRAAVLNNGLSAETFQLTMEVLESGAAIASETVTVGPLPSDQQTTVSFTPITVAAGHLYELRATATLAGDLNPLNDSARAYNDSYTQQRVPLGLLFTNAACPPCVQANQAMDSYMPGQGDAVALIRIHVWWPGADIMYNANPLQAQALVSEYGVSGVPNFFMDGNVDMGTDGPGFAAAFEARKQMATSSTIGLSWNPATQKLTVDVEHLEMLRPSQDLRLLVAVTEDDIHYLGSNGEPIHNQAMRYYFPDTYGTVPMPTGGGVHRLVLDCPLNPGWSYGKLRATAYLQDVNSRAVLQAVTRFLSAIEFDPTAVGETPARAASLLGGFPNPFNPATEIRFRLAGEQDVALAIHGLDGRRVATLAAGTLPAGEHAVRWEGRDDQGRPVASGAYFCRLTAGGASETRPLMLVK